MLENLNIPTWFIDTAMFVFRVKYFLNLFVISPSLCLFPFSERIFPSAFFPLTQLPAPLATITWKLFVPVDSA